MPGRSYVLVATINTISIYSGTGDPNGVVPASRGSIYSDDAVAGQLWKNVSGAMVWAIVSGTGEINELWVSSTADLATADGSLENPFSTPQAAVDKAAASSRAVWILHLGAGTYASELSIPDTISVSLVGSLYGMVEPGISNDVPVVLAPPSGNVLWSFDATRLQLFNARIDGNLQFGIAGQGDLLIQDSEISGLIQPQAPSAASLFCTIRGTFASWGGLSNNPASIGFLSGFETRVGDVDLTSTGLTRLIASGVEIGGNVTADSVYLEGCFFLSFAAQAISLSNPALCSMKECTWRANAPTITFTGVAGTITMDVSTYKSFLARVGVLTNGSFTTEWYNPIPTYNDAFPGFGVPVLVPLASRYRSVFGLIQLAAAAGDDAVVDIEVETGIGTGIFVGISSYFQLAGDLNDRVYGFNFDVPGGRQYQFTAGGLGVTEAVSQYNLMDF